MKANKKPKVINGEYEIILTIVCPVMSSSPEPPEAKFTPLKLSLLTVDELFRDRKGGGLFL